LGEVEDAGGGRVNLKRYDPIEYFSQGGSGLGTMKEEPEGDWVRFEDVLALVERSRLYEADGYQAVPDSCGKPVYKKGLKILVCKRRMELEGEKTKLLQQLAACSRRIAELQHKP
jgi:hypothetical protein